MPPSSPHAPPAPLRARGGWLLAALLAGCAAPPLAPAPDAERPNLVLVVADDHGYADFGFMGSRVVRTPNLDRLAQEGALFPLGYSTASICRPALLSLLTGLEPLQVEAHLARLGGERARVPFLRAFPTLPRALARSGYATFQAGKYWEGTYPVAGFGGGMGGIAEAKRLVRETLQPVEAFLDARGSQPFFLWFAPLLPHLPHDAPREYLDLYAGERLEPAARAYYATISWLDAAVGQLLGLLEARGLRERTLVAFLADNGWQVEGFNRDGRFWDGPRGKYTLYEMGFRTPVVFHWPGRVPAGQRNESLVSFPDVVATLLGFAGVRPHPAVRGIDLRGVLASGALSPRDALLGSMSEVRLDPPGAGRGLGPGGAFLRDRRWHYLLYDDRPEELYDVESDPGETRNLAPGQPALCADLRRRVERWRAEIQADPLAAKGSPRGS